MFLHRDHFFISDPGGGNNQIPGECTISGDIRLIQVWDFL